ncbi:MAG TPA: c-type cytochrome [Blastocatellia bacterium]|nr:c-type cytochrome [Blastocatellia bacterium]
MRNLKFFVALSLSALLWVSCSGGSEPASNANKAPATPASAPSATNANDNAASSQPSTASASNANTASKESAKPAETTKAADEKKADEKKKDEAKTEPPKAKVDAAALFTENKCAGCHGADGKGSPKIKGIPDFTDAAWQKKTPDGDMTEAIKSGKKPLMPAFGSKLNEDQVKALVGYVRGFAKK